MVMLRIFNYDEYYKNMDFVKLYGPSSSPVNNNFLLIFYTPTGGWSLPAGVS